MTERAAIRSVRPASARVSAEPAPPGLAETLAALLRELPGMISDRVNLLSLELQQASGALARMLVLVIAAAVFAVTAWIGLWFAIAFALVRLGMPGVAAVGIVVLINAGGVAWALLRARSLVPLVALPATKRHLTLGASSVGSGER